MSERDVTYICAEDHELFAQLCDVADEVARKYALPLHSVGGIENPKAPTWLGTCSAVGDIKVCTRFREADGSWTERREEQAIWNTLAHELAHLRYMNHGTAFQLFEEELQEAVANVRNHGSDKLIAKLLKIKQQAQGERDLGNTEAAENFAAMLNRMLLQHELSEADLNLDGERPNDPIVEIKVDLESHSIQEKSSRSAWQETLAGHVARANCCRILIRPRSNNIWMVGTRSHALVAEFTYGTLVRLIKEMAHKERGRYRRECREEYGDVKMSLGFKAAWIDAFVERISERLHAVQADATKERAATVATEGTDGFKEAESSALMVINTAKRRVDDYLDQRFGRKRKYGSHLNGGRSNHSEGRARGHAAANNVPLNKGVGAGARGSGGPRGALKG